MAQADIEQFHDRDPWGFTYRGLLARKVPAELGKAALRLHRLPNVILRVGGSSTRVLERSRGVLTGAASSGMLARICIEDSCTAALPEILGHGFEVEGSHTLVGMSWSDNLFTFSSSITQACTMMAIWASYLYNLCGLVLKSGSHEIIHSSPRLYANELLEQDGVVWKSASTIVCLGHTLTSNGDSSQDRKRLKRSWEAAFWRNSRVLTCSKINLRSRLQFWKALSQGVGNYRFSMWPPSCAFGRQVEGWHNAILQRIVRVPLAAGQSPEEFCKHRNRIIANERHSVGLSVRRAWAGCLVRWLEHLRRHPETPSAMVFAVQDDLWMDTVRFLYAAGSTGTRTGPGKPIRWGERWVGLLEESCGIENPLRDKGLTRERTSLLETMMQHGRLHGVAACTG